jgi:hypothetical protein
MLQITHKFVNKSGAEMGFMDRGHLPQRLSIGDLKELKMHQMDNTPITITSLPE